MLTTTETFKQAVVERAAQDIWWKCCHGKAPASTPEGLLSMAQSILDSARQACRDMDRRDDRQD